LIPPVKENFSECYFKKTTLYSDKEFKKSNKKCQLFPHFAFSNLQIYIQKPHPPPTKKFAFSTMVFILNDSSF